MNLGLAAMIRRMATLPLRADRRRPAPEFVVAMLLLLAGTFGLSGDLMHQARILWFRAGLVQPYIPQSLKWDPAAAQENLRILANQTKRVSESAPDIILWPEAAVPYVLKAQPELQRWLEDQARLAGAPILGGVVVLEPVPQPEGRWYNAAVVVDPQRGLQPEYYAKRHLVPFGEYVPLHSLFGWIRKFAPIGDDFQPGERSSPLSIQTLNGPVAAGVLICYEDVFSDMARASAVAGAEVLVNLTNNAWYGEGAAAYQHAAHSALRAAETRRPVVRCGNGGWSGWFDEYGGLRQEVTDAHGTVYFRGTGLAALTRDPRWVGQTTLYVRHGDWFVAVCAGLAAAAFLLLRKRTA
jgi:apolipoprotein N-acyltransferase